MADQQTTQQHEQSAAKAAVAQARALIAENLPEIAREILEWRRTSVLTGDKLRSAERMLLEHIPFDTLHLVENMARDAAFELIVQQNQDGASPVSVGASAEGSAADRLEAAEAVCRSLKRTPALKLTGHRLAAYEAWRKTLPPGDNGA